jgi:hypothetical protein
VPITGYAQGVITLNGSHPSGYQFTPGEAVYLTFVFDPAKATTVGQPAGTPTRQSYDVGVPWSFSVTTGGGFTSNGSRSPSSGFFSNGIARVENGATDRFELEFYTGTGGITLTYTDPTGTALASTALPTLADLLRFPGGTLDFYREGRFDQGFRSTVRQVADASDFPVPEPSTLALGAIGVGVLGLAGMRRRKGAGATRRRDRGGDA